MDKKVIEKIYALVNDGLCNLKEIERALQFFVKHEMFKGRDPPELTNRRFFPTKRDIRNHYNLAFSKRKLAKLDQENVARLIEEWRKSATDQDNIFFRPYIAAEADAIVTTVQSSHDENSPIIIAKQTLLFVYQLQWQQRLLLRYGQDICLLDATYKTSKYALPLFFLSVKTNVNYQVVATFILQNETETDIEEALKILKQWNPLWSPSYFMTDKSYAEIHAIERSFLGKCLRLI